MELNTGYTLNALLVSALEARNMLRVNMFNDLTKSEDNNDFKALMVTIQSKPPLVSLITDNSSTALVQTWVGKGGVGDLLARATCSYILASRCTSVKDAIPDNQIVNAGQLLALDEVITHLRENFAICYEGSSQDSINQVLGEEADKRNAWILAFEFLLHHCPPENTNGYTING